MAKGQRKCTTMLPQSIPCTPQGAQPPAFRLNIDGGIFIRTTYPNFEGAHTEQSLTSVLIAQSDVEVVWCWARGPGWRPALKRGDLKEGVREGATSRLAHDHGRMQWGWEHSQGAEAVP